MHIFPKNQEGTYPSCKQEASAISSCIVGQPDLDTISWEFMSISCTNDHVSFQSGIRYLASDIFVCETNNGPLYVNGLKMGDIDLFFKVAGVKM